MELSVYSGCFKGVLKMVSYDKICVEYCVKYCVYKLELIDDLIV